MKSLEFMRQLEVSRKAVFSFSDLVKILGKDESYVKVFVNRLAKKELLRLERNKYVVKGTNPFLVASNLIFPSYISFVSAFSYYNLTTQLPRVFYVVTLKQRKPLTYNNNLIQFVKFDKSRFFGLRREALGNKLVFVAEPEKAIVDSLYLPKYCSVSETFFALRNLKFDLEKLLHFAERMDSSATIQRLSYLLELMGIDVPEKFRSSIKNYIFLNPTLPKKGKRNKKWKLIVNEVLE